MRYLLALVGLVACSVATPASAQLSPVAWTDGEDCGPFGRRAFGTGPLAASIEPNFGMRYDVMGAWSLRHGVDVLLYEPCGAPLLFGGGLSFDHRAPGSQGGPGLGLTTKAVVSYHWLAEVRRGSWSVLAPRFEFGVRLPLSAEQRPVPSVEAFAGLELVRFAGVFSLWTGVQVRSPNPSSAAGSAGRPDVAFLTGFSVALGVRPDRARGQTHEPTSLELGSTPVDRRTIRSTRASGSSRQRATGDFADRLVAEALAEERAFRRPSQLYWCATCKDERTRMDAAWERVAEFWSEGIGARHPDAWAGEHWSAAFVSAMVKRANPHLSFEGHARHADYIQDAYIAAQTNDEDYLFAFLNPADAEIRTGDVICHGREAAAAVRFETLADDAQRLGGNRPGHCDIVVSVSDGSALLVGGNLTATVRTKQRTLSGGRLAVDGDGKYEGDAEHGPAVVLRPRPEKADADDED